MRITFTMKTPDIVDLIVQQNVSSIGLQAIHDGSMDGYDEILGKEEPKLREALERYISNGENIQLCIDTDTHEMTVIPRI
jgi:hypothetical protein